MSLLRTFTQSPEEVEAMRRRYVEQNELEYELDKPVKLIVVGAGNRGKVYSMYAQEHPSRAKIVAVVDVVKYRRESLAKLHKVPQEFIFSNWEDAAALDKFADAVVIATPDTHHAEPTIAFANKGYHIMVEKPMAVTEEDCIRMTKAAKDNNIIMAVGHVLRYTPYTQKIKELIKSNAIGEVINVQHLEPVGYWHHAHSYVRGNWRREDEATFMLMAKSCHDIDWIRYILGKKCKRVSSFGSLAHFRKENKPAEAKEATKCMDCPISNECPYSAKKVYLDPVSQGQSDWQIEVLVSTGEPTVESVTEALNKGPFGRCVYECDNDVVDNQVVNMEFEGGRTASFTMVAFTQDLCVRKTRIFGTHGQMECDGTKILLHSFRGKGSEQTIYPEDMPPTRMAGHGGADYYLMRSFIDSVAKGNTSRILSGPDETLESHLLVFQAEQARLTDQVVTIF